MHIVLTHSRYPPHSGSGGIAMYNHHLSRGLARLGHRVTVVSSRSSSNVPDHEEVESIGIYRLLTHDRYRFRRLPVVGHYMRSLLQVLYSTRVAAILSRLHRKDEVDVVEFAEVGAEGYIYLHLPWKRPVVVRCHTPTAILRRHYQPEEMSYSTTWTEANERYCVRAADLLTTPSQDMARVVSESYDVHGMQFRALANPIDVSMFERTRGCKTNGGNSRGVLVLHVGRLERVKGIDVLVRAIPRVVEQAPKTRFAFIGEDRADALGRSCQEQLMKSVRERGVQDHVKFLGSVDQSTLIAWYHRADVAVVPSLNYESFSYTCAQAMAAGLPVVASRIGGIPETLDDGISGLLVEPGKVEALSQALVILARDGDLRRRMGEAGSSKARRCFDASVVAEQMVQLYASAL